MFKNTKNASSLVCFEGCIYKEGKKKKKTHPTIFKIPYISYQYLKLWLGQLLCDVFIQPHNVFWLYSPYGYSQIT